MNSYKNENLQTLIKQAQKENESALGELLRREQKNVYSALYYLNAAPDEISDLVQEVLLKVAKNIKKLKSPEHFKAWINQITIRQFYDSLRKKQRSFGKVSLSSQNDDECKIDIPDLSLNPPQKALVNELDCVIKKSINKLSKPFKVAIIMRELQGLSYEQIADATNSSVGTVKSRIARARGKLQEYIKPYII